MQPTQPKITQKLLLRTAIGIFVLAGLVLAFRWYKTHESDPRGDDAMDTTGYIAAIESGADGGQVVVFKNDLNGIVIHQPNVSPTVEDRDIAWRPDGNFLFFASNRDKGKFTMFRWPPDGKSDPEMRSLEGLPQGSPFFLQSDAEKHADTTGLIIAGGRVASYEPKVPALYQVLPPPDPKHLPTMDAESGSGSAFDLMYERFGTSFRAAKWTPDRKAVVAVMRREDGEVLIYQRLDVATPQDSQPRAIIQGDRVDFDIDQTTGLVCFAVQNFQWPLGQVPPEYLKNGFPTVPFRHGLGVIDLSQQRPLQWIQQSKDNKLCFGGVALSPQGDKVAAVMGPYKGSGNMTPQGLLVAGLSGPGQGQVAEVEKGEIYEPSWSPDGSKIVYAERVSKASRAIFVLGSGSPPQRVSPEEGVFSHPMFSPQLPK